MAPALAECQRVVVRTWRNSHRQFEALGSVWRDHHGGVVVSF